MAAQILNSETESQPMERNSLVDVDEHRLEQVIAQGSLDFDEWTSLISEIENSFPDGINKICLVYDSFLAEFPLCYGYWMKYADHMARLCTVDKVVEVFERAVQSATYSVDVWFHYCSFSMSAFEDPSNVRRLFKRALSFVKKDYLCHTLWDKYLEFEFSQQRWSSLAHIYIQTLRFPSKRLHRYYEGFKRLAGAWKEELDCQSDLSTELQSHLALESGLPTYGSDNDISIVIKDLLDPSGGLARSKAVQKYLFIGEQIYKEACQLDEKIHCFETRIRRPYFHVKPLDGSQLENWHDYLNFAEKQGDFDWVVKLYERCLIPCANYPEFWMRYVDFVESKGGREIANFALARATQIFLKRVPVVHLFNAQYKEQIGDVSAARAALRECDTDADSIFIGNVTIKANMEKRLGNFVAACNIFKEALETAAEKKKLHILPILYIRLSRLKYMITNSADAARDILIDGIKHVPRCKLLLEELIKFAMMHGGSRHMNVVDSVMADAIYSGPDVPEGFSREDVEDLSSLYLQLVDLCGTIHDVRKVWYRHTKLFPHSMGTAYEHKATCTKPLKTVMEGRQTSVVALSPRPSVFDHPIQSPSQDKKMSPPENYDIQSCHAATALLSEQRSPRPENNDIQCAEGATIDHLQAGEAENSLQEKTQQVSPEVREQHVEDVCEANMSSLDLVHQVGAETEAKASLEFSKEDYVQHESEYESKKDMKPLSLEGLSLGPQEHQSPGSVCPTYQEREAPQETSFSHESTLKSEALQENSILNGSMQEVGQNTNGSHLSSSPMSTQVSDSAQIQNEAVSPSSLAPHQNFVTDDLSQPQKPMNSGRNWHQKHNNDKSHRDSRFGFRGHSHKRLHQQRRASAQQYPHAESRAQMPMSQGYASQPLPSQSSQVEQGNQAHSQYPASPNLTAPQIWPMQNVQQQNFASASQVPVQSVAYVGAQMSQFPMQSLDQQGHLQNNQAYNQMWHYYYYQHQQQQQLLLQQQPHQEQLLQQQYQSQQYFQQQQLQQQQLQPQQQHFLPQQPQQQHFLPQQPYQQQQHLLYLPQQLQYQQVQQQQQQPPHHQQQEQEQRQPEHQNTVLQIETRNHYSSEQDKGVAPPYSTVALGTVTSAASPNPQQQSSQSL